MPAVEMEACAEAERPSRSPDATGSQVVQACRHLRSSSLGDFLVYQSPLLSSFDLVGFC